MNTLFVGLGSSPRSCRTGRLPRQVAIAERYEALRKLTRHRFHLVQTITSEKQRFLNLLFLKCSGLAQQRPLKRTFGATATGPGCKAPLRGCPSRRWGDAQVWRHDAPGLS